MFLKEIGSWMADPKLPPSVRERWFDIWERVDPGITSKVGSYSRPCIAGVETGLYGRPGCLCCQRTSSVPAEDCLVLSSIRRHRGLSLLLPTASP